MNDGKETLAALKALKAKNKAKAAAKAKPKPATAPKPKAKSFLVNFKVNEAMYAEFERKAKAHAGGNVSRWLRISGMNYAPPSKMDDPLKASKKKPA